MFVHSILAAQASLKRSVTRGTFQSFRVTLPALLFKTSEVGLLYIGALRWAGRGFTGAGAGCSGHARFSIGTKGKRA